MSRICFIMSFPIVLSNSPSAGASRDIESSRIVRGNADPPITNVPFSNFRDVLREMAPLELSRKISPSLPIYSERRRPLGR